MQSPFFGDQAFFRASGRRTRKVKQNRPICGAVELAAIESADIYAAIPSSLFFTEYRAYLFSNIVGIVR